MFKNMELPTGRTGRSDYRRSSNASDKLDIPKLADLLCKIKIWGDLEDEVKFRAFVLPSEVRHARFFDAADDGLIATLDDNDTTALTAHDLADVLTWHVDYRDNIWLSTVVRQLDEVSLDLFVKFTPLAG